MPPSRIHPYYFKVLIAIVDGLGAGLPTVLADQRPAAHGAKLVDRKVLNEESAQNLLS